MSDTAVLFEPFQSPKLTLTNRIVMAPMTRNMAPGGVPRQANADYYARRAAGGVGLILSEGTVVDRPASRNLPDIPFFHGEEPLGGWKAVIDAVHAAGGKMGPQIWHTGGTPSSDAKFERSALDTPSGLNAPGQAVDPDLLCALTWPGELLTVDAAHNRLHVTLSTLRREGLRDFGACMSPQNAFYILQGVETLPVRMDRICQNTLAVAQFLASHPQVTWVKYAGLPDHPDHQLAKKYMRGQASGILTFGVKGGRKAGEKFLDALKLVIRLVNIGDARSLATHPASTTHRQLAPEELAKAGVSEDMVRLSIGLEHIDDLKEDIDQALKASAR